MLAPDQDRQSEIHVSHPPSKRALCENQYLDRPLSNYPSNSCSIPAQFKQSTPHLSICSYFREILAQGSSLSILKDIALISTKLSLEFRRLHWLCTRETLNCVSEAPEVGRQIEPLTRLPRAQRRAYLDSISMCAMHCHKNCKIVPCP